MASSIDESNKMTPQHLRILELLNYPAYEDEYTPEGVELLNDLVRMGYAEKTINPFKGQHGGAEECYIWTDEGMKYFIERDRESVFKGLQEQPPYQPATPQEPAPKVGQKNFPNIEKFNEEGKVNPQTETGGPPLPKATELESLESQISNLQKQIDNLDMAHEELWNDVISGRSPLERTKPEEKETRPGYCPSCHIRMSVGSHGGGEDEDGNPIEKEYYYYCDECGADYSEEEPDPSNPDRELNPDPDIPEPVEPTEHVTADGLDVPDKVEIPERLYNDLMMMIEYSTTNDNEAGGFLIVAKHGELGVVGEQFGKDREIVLEPNEQLHEGEQLIGTVHMHPVTPTASTGDVGGYMNDENEKVMVVVGADKSINVMFKTDFTAEGDYGDEISDNFEQEDMNLLAEGLGFIWYRGEESDRTTLNIVTNVVDDVELNVVDETWPIEDLVKALGIKGRPDIPESYSTKKQPLKLQIPFSWKCNERRLI